MFLKTPAAIFVHLFVLLLNQLPIMAVRSSMTYNPQGNSPLLYQPGNEPIMHLDQVTFADTVFDALKTNAFLVEFYADWCGHCRAFAPFFRDFSQIVQNWAPVVRIAVINCADSFNTQVCRSNGIHVFPTVKYFPRFANNYDSSQLLEPSHSAANLREQLALKVLNDYSQNNYNDWPNINILNVNGSTTFDDLWEGVLPSANYLVIVFEQFAQHGVQMILDMYPYTNKMGVRRALFTSPLVAMLNIRIFPFVAMFERSNPQAILMEPLSEHSYQNILNRMHLAPLTTMAPLSDRTPKPSIIDCTKSPEKCSSLYFVSETDMLKALRMALLDEVIRSRDIIEGEHFSNLKNFISIVSEFYPVTTHSTTEKRTRRAISTPLKNSERARAFFGDLKRTLDQKNNKTISIDEWKDKVESAEKFYSNPFPVNASWQHCRGTSPEFRGYTCALWTTFHTLTVNSYLDSIKTKKLDPLRPLKAIQGWVSSFFGCEQCKKHFMQMTTETFPMSETRVSRPHETMMYLWRAHNIVNNRLKNQSTEDPQFVKYQFPPTFLCPLCHTGGHFSRRQVRNFLLRYYTSIHPTHRIHTNLESGSATTNPIVSSTAATTTTLANNTNPVLVMKRMSKEITLPFRTLETKQQQQQEFKDNAALQRTTVALSEWASLRPQ